MRGAQVRCAGVSDHERLRAFASSYERLRAYSSAPSRAQSRLVAFSRANFFFACSGPVGRVLSYRVVSFRHSFVILRHSSSQNRFFSGMAGNGRLRHWLGREGSRLLRVAPAAGAGWASCHDIRFKLVCNCGRAAAALVHSSQEQLYYRIGEFAVPGIHRGHPRLLCVK